MPTRFTATERTAIRERLLAEARTRIPRDGLHGTSLADLTESAGIAKSTFYTFFDSKEALVLELLAELGPGAEARILGAARDTENARDGLAALLRAYLRETETQPLLRRLVRHPDELRAVARRVGPDELAAKTRALRPLDDWIRAAQVRGELRTDLDPELIVGVVRAVATVPLHEADLGARTSEIVELLVDLVADGLAEEETR